MDINKVFSGSYLKAADLGGRRISVIIREVLFERFQQDGSEEEQKLVVYFEGKDKGLVLNKTNANMIAEIATTTETDEWPGVQIVLYSANVDFQGKRVPALRVDYMPNAKPRPAPVDDSDIPF